MKLLCHEGFTVDKKEIVHSSTLKSWIREQTEAGQEIPPVFGAWTGRRAKIMKGK